MASPKHSGRAWRKSSRSNGSGGACVELMAIGTGIAVRDSKNRRGGALLFGRDAFRAFAMRVRSGANDR